MEIKVCVIIPSAPMVHMNFTLALVRMVAGSAMGGIKIGCLNPRGAYVQKSRFRAVRKAMEFGVDYVLFIDSDMSFPDDALARLIAADKDIVGANYVRRAPPFDSLAKVNGDQSVSGVIEVEGMPTGLLLIKIDVFKKIPEPWFEVNWDADFEDYHGEDYWFCDLARKHGFKVWMDCDLSAQVVHWGEMGFRWTGEGKGYGLVAEPLGG